MQSLKMLKFAVQVRVWLSGRALASQAEGRGFDPRHPLKDSA